MEVLIGEERKEFNTEVTESTEDRGRREARTPG
jgi:hypothetical protein